ncbi:endonuclease domain-containing protein [Streptomyces sp. NPDC004296]|uniref:endonuclease domain-containing protein n=1 Tax=Streptomyces sp. NPDC004296 TaxID=3364697 RepID=UPI0036C8C37A
MALPDELLSAVVPAESLDQLPAPRRETMLWHGALSFTYEDVDDYVRAERHRTACVVPPQFRAGDWCAAVAVRGSDSRFHLRLGEQLVCGASHRRGGRVSVGHQQYLGWWTDGSRYRIGTPFADGAFLPGDRGSRDMRWRVWLTEETAEPSTIPQRQRCPVRARFGQWPTHINPSTAKGRLRFQLVEAFGPMCAGCGDAYGVYIDHEHFTGLVRGLLCHYCNTHIDHCPHLSGCPWAAYLDNPPAAPLGLLHPDRKQDRRRDQRKIELLGFDPYDL